MQVIGNHPSAARRPSVALSSPGAIPAATMGYTMARLDEAGFRKVVLGLLMISGLGLVVRWS